MIHRKINRFIVYIATAICFSFGVQSGVAQSIQTFIDKKDILIGEQIHYKLQFTLPTSNYRIEFNVPDSFQHFEILDKVKSDSTNGRGNYLIMQNILLTSWDSGSWSIPSFPIKIRNNADNAEYTLNTDEIKVNVGYMPVDSSGKPRDIKPLMDVVYIDQDWILIAAAALLTLILLIVLWRWWRKRPKKEKPLFQSPLTAYEEAVQKLKELMSTNLTDPEAVKQYHTSLSEIFKRYYSRRLQKNLLNKTTGEMLLLLSENNLRSDDLSPIAEALRSGDAVKFAKYLPPVYESEQCLEQIGKGIEKIEKSSS